ncbi:MAG: DUF1289 domain-containing protein [Pseudomonadota bacterium]
MGKIPSPCIDVCKHKMRGGHCIGCSMTKAQKSDWKRLDGKKEKRAFIAMLVAQQAYLGGKFKGWAIAYRRLCAKKGVACPLDEMENAR